MHMYFNYISASIFIVWILFANSIEAQEIKYVNAQDIINIAKQSNKPYTWATIYVPRCPTAATQFEEFVRLYKQHEDKVNLMILTIVMSKINHDSLVKFTKEYGFDTPFYVLDTAYADDNFMKTHFRFMDDMNRLLGKKKKFFGQIILDKEGKLVFKTSERKMHIDEGDMKKYIR